MIEWILKKRKAICAECESAMYCRVRSQLTATNPLCPLGKIKTEAQEIVARAWPAAGGSISGCCDSPLNYL